MREVTRERIKASAGEKAGGIKLQTYYLLVIPANAGNQCFRAVCVTRSLDSRLRGNDSVVIAPYVAAKHSTQPHHYHSLAQHAHFDYDNPSGTNEGVKDMQDEFLQPEPGEYAEATSPPSGGKVPVTRVIKLTRISIAGEVALYALESVPLAIGIALATQLSWPLEPDDYLILMPVAIISGVGIPAVYRLADYLLFRRYRGELHFDGTTVVSMVPGKSPESFTRREVLGYFPHRNEVLLVDGRTIPLPACGTHIYYHEPKMATPWMKAWWPEIDLTKAISTAEKAQGWIRHVPNAVKAITLTTVFCCVLTPSDFSLEVMFGAVFLLLFFPDWIENRLRRNVMITMGSGTDAPTST